MAAKFSEQSGMNLTWSVKCLEENRWAACRAKRVVCCRVNCVMLCDAAVQVGVRGGGSDIRHGQGGRQDPAGGLRQVIHWTRGGEEEEEV